MNNNIDYNKNGIIIAPAGYGKTEDIFYKPKDKRTEDYITGRFG